MLNQLLFWNGRRCQNNILNTTFESILTFQLIGHWSGHAVFLQKKKWKKESSLIDFFNVFVHYYFITVMKKMKSQQFTQLFFFV